MTTVEAVNHFGTQKALADKLGCGQPAIANWGKYPPAGRQLQLEKLTHGLLQSEPNIFRTRKKAA